MLYGERATVRDGVRHEDGAAVPDRLRGGVPDHHAAGKFTYGTAVDVGYRATVYKDMIPTRSNVSHLCANISHYNEAMSGVSGQMVTYTVPLYLPSTVS